MVLVHAFAGSNPATPAKYCAKGDPMAYIDEFNYRDCPWCKTKSVAFVKIQNTTRFTDSKGATREWTWLRCPRCAGVISIDTKHGINPAALAQVIPESRNELDVEHLPANVEEYYLNAIKALDAGIPSSAAVELRRTLEAAAKHQEVEAKTLVAAVKKLVEKGFITKSFEDALSHVRKIGNQGAHASDVSLSENDVRMALSFTTQVLRNLFEVPESLKLLQEDETTGTEFES